MSFGVTDDLDSNGRHRARDAADHSEGPRRRSRRDTWDNPPPVDEPRRRPDPLTDPLDALDGVPARERRAPIDDEVPPGRSVPRRNDPARSSGRVSRESYPDDADRPRRVPQQRRSEPGEDYRGRVLPRRPDRPRDADERRGDVPDRPRRALESVDRAREVDPAERPRRSAEPVERRRPSGEIERPRAEVERQRGEIERLRGVADTGDRVRGVADTGDRLRRSGEIDRPRGVADTGDRTLRGAEPIDRPRGVADTGDRIRGIADTGDRVRGVADTGDRMRRSGEIDRPRGLADTGDRVRGIADTGERPRAAARASVPVAGRAVVGDPVRPDVLRPDPIRPDPVRPDVVRPDGLRPDPVRPDVLRPDGLRPDVLRPAEPGRVESRAEARAGRVAPAPDRPRATRAVSRTITGEPEAVRRLNPLDLPDARGYSHATVATGQLVFLAAQSGVDLDGRIVDGGLVGQLDRALQNLLVALAAAGGSADQLVSVTVQVTSMDEYKANSRPIGRIWRARLGDLMPALSLSEVRRFWDAEAEVQVSAQAVLP